MFESIENQVKKLRALFWSDRDQEGQGFVALAESYRRAGDLDQALELLQEGLGRLPDHASGLVVLGWVYIDRGELNEAQAIFDRVVSMDPDNTAALRGLGDLSVLDDRLDEARDYYRRCLAVDPADAEVAERLDRLDPGVEILDGEPESEEFAAEPEAAAEDGTEPEPAAELDVEPEAAAEPESEASEELPGPVDDLELAAEVLGEVPDGAATPAVEEDPGEVYTSTMAEIYAGQGLHLKAVEVYERVLDADPDNAEIQARIDELRGLAGVSDAEDDRASGDEADHGMAAHMDEGHGEHEVETPFAWSTDEQDPSPAEGEALGPGRTVGEYFEALLSWEPEAEPPLPIEDMAPVEEAGETGPEVTAEAAVPTADPDVIAIEDLAPEPAAEPMGEPDPHAHLALVPVELLAPDEDADPHADLPIVPVASLAPDPEPAVEPEVAEPTPVDSEPLPAEPDPEPADQAEPEAAAAEPEPEPTEEPAAGAEDGVSDGTPAADPPSMGGEEGGDAFDDWLKGLKS